VVEAPDSGELVERQGLLRSGSLQALLDKHRDSLPLTAGATVAELLVSHSYYVDKEIVWEGLDVLGPVRTVAEHLDYAEEFWDAARVPTLHSRHVVLALAFDASLGWSLLQSGVVASMLQKWRPESGARDEPYRLVWDMLNNEGRARVDERPLLAAAFGAPAEWTAELSADVTQLAWSPGGERVAALVDGQVFEVAPGLPPRRINDVDPNVTSLGWADRGVVALRVVNGTAEMVQVPTRSTLGTMTSVSGGRVSGDGSHAWLEGSDGVVRWSPMDPDPSPIGPPSQVLAVDASAQIGLLHRSENQVLVSSRPGSLPAGMRVPGEPEWPSDAASMIGWGPTGERGPRALVTLGRRPTVATTADGGGVLITAIPSPGLAHLATGAGQVTALATDASGTQLAVAVGKWVGVWTLSRERPVSRSIPGYDSDRASGPDLLGADRDARALAALIASRDLRPPLAIGLFGAWGSGKSFVLNRIETLLGELAGPSAPEGYLDHITLVRFNAWHYAEANLWASLVDHVLQKIGPARVPEIPQEVKDADERLAAATAEAGAVATEIEQAGTALERAQSVLAIRRRNAWRLVAGVLVLAAIAMVAVVIGGPARVVAGISAVVALLGTASAAYGQAKLAGQHAGELVEAGKAGFSTLGRLAGRPEELAVRAAATKMQDLEDTQARVLAETDRLQAEVNRLRELAKSEPLGALLHNLATVTEYRDQLSLVARTRERFDRINSAVRRARQPQRGATSLEEGLRLERVVIVIDDLDRCPAENVVKVLEAVHLLFDFEMFVVVLAVDTRWLDQSLRIRYRQLLGEADTAAPLDYLEKIIQVPVQLPPLDEGLVRTMISGLTGQTSLVTTAPEPDRPADTEPEPALTTDQSQVVAVAAEHKRPTRAPLPAEVLKIGPEEATALSAVASLVGTTPRTVKRFVNTYQLIKARSLDPAAFADADGSPAPADIVAFLLAVLTSRAAAAHLLFRALATAGAHTTLQTVVGALQPPPPPSPGPGNADPSLQQEIADLNDWVARHPDHANAKARDVAAWVREVARFSFTRQRSTDNARPS
jgi:KAP family P-loop domain